MIAIVGAMNIEIESLLNRMEVINSFVEKKYYFVEGRYGNKKVVIVKTGVGIKNATRAVEKLVSIYPIEKVICLGVAGAVEEGLAAGDCIVVSACGSLKEKEIFKADEVLLAVAKEQAKTFRNNIFFKSMGMTVDKVFYEKDKKELKRQNKGIAYVDMENYGWSKIFSSKGIPFILIRAVSDNLNFKFPQDLSLIKEKYNFKDFYRLLKTCIPGKVKDLWSVICFSYNWKKAVRNNTLFVMKLLAEI